MDVTTVSETLFIRFVRSSPIDLEAEILTILQLSGIKKLNELPACVTNYLSLCSVYLELQSRLSIACQLLSVSSERGRART